MTDSTIPRLFQIEKVIRETADSVTMHLRGDANGGFQPGQFNMLYAFGVGEIPISISGNPSNMGVMTHTTRMVGTVSNAIGQLRAGGILGLRGPYGRGWPMERARGSDVVIVAGGIGLAPLRPVIYQLLSERDKYGRIVLLYGTRSPADLLFRKELENWRGRFDFDVHISVDHAIGDWRGNVGFVTTFISRVALDPQNTVAMICGPEIMMRFSVMEFLKRGVSAEEIFVSMERNMKCGIGLCGHCQFGPYFICKDGPVFAYPQVKEWLSKGEI